MCNKSIFKRIDRNYVGMIRDAMKLCPDLDLQTGKKHDKLVNLSTGDYIPVCTSASNYRGMANFKSDLRALSERGEGLIYSRTGRKPNGHQSVRL